MSAVNILVSSTPTLTVLHMNSPVSQVLTIKQFVEDYGLGRTRAYAEIAAGRLKIMKFGRSTRIARTDADAWLEARRQEGGFLPKQAA